MRPNRLRRSVVDPTHEEPTTTILPVLLSLVLLVLLLLVLFMPVLVVLVFLLTSDNWHQQDYEEKISGRLEQKYVQNRKHNFIEKNRTSRILCTVL
jgi:uncharacterized membrane protein